MAAIKMTGLSELIGLIHDAGLTPASWPESIDRIRVAMSGTAALLFTPQHAPEAGGMAISSQLSADVMEHCAGMHRQMEQRLHAGGGMKRKFLIPGTVATDEDLSSRQSLADGTNYRNLLASANFTRLCTSLIVGPGSATVPATVISIFRGLDAPPFGRGAKNLLRLLVPHLSRSLALMYRLREAEQTLAASLAALDKMACGVVLFGRLGTVVHSNRLASALLAENDGVGLEGKLQQGPRLAAASEALGAGLNRLVAGAVSAASAERCCAAHGMRLPRKSGRAPIVIGISPLPLHRKFECNAEPALAIGFLFDSALSPLPDAHLLAETYGLTPAETRLVGELCSGLTLGRIGECHGVSTETLKSQLKSIFAKTGMRRQMEVVRLANLLAIT